LHAAAHSTAIDPRVLGGRYVAKLTGHKAVKYT
jgi:hypothetical protein